MNVHFLSKKHDWATPWPLFRELNARFGPCELDVYATVRELFFTGRGRTAPGLAWRLLDESSLRAP